MKNAADCVTTGIPLYWPDLCVTFAVHELGSMNRGISYTRAEDSSRRAFQTWISADCGGRNPSIGVVSVGKVYCDQVEYNHDFDGDEENPPSTAGPNANLIVFRDTEWPYTEGTSTIALTTITFAKSTGEILDADIEVNTANHELTTGDVNVRSDLQSVMTHEIGHFFGLAHSSVDGASMNPNYNSGNLDFRSISEDDRAGICEIYGPLAGTEAETAAGGGVGVGVSDAIDCRGEEPRFGFSRYCGEQVLADGCTVASPGRQESNLTQGLEAALSVDTQTTPLRPGASEAAHQRAEQKSQFRARQRAEALVPLLSLLVPFSALAWMAARRRRRK